jgi:hypothetical protein
MPDAFELMTAMIWAAGTAAALLLAVAVFRRPAPTARIAIGWVLAVGLGFAAGAWALGRVPRWPPRQDIDRLLIFVLPITLVVELACASRWLPRWIVWILRGAIAVTFARVLLHNSVYLSSVAEHPSSEWSTPQTITTLGTIAAITIANWCVLSRVTAERFRWHCPLALAAVCLSGGIAIMLSGYLTAGQLACPLSASLAAATMVAIFLAGPNAHDGWLGVGLIMLAGLIVVGRYFSDLTTFHGVLLITAPVWVAIVELPWWRPKKPWWRTTIALGLVALPLALVLVQASQRFAERSTGPASLPGKTGPSVDDYLGFGQ